MRLPRPDAARPAAPGRWVFLRGLGRHSLHWDSFPDLFRQAFPNAEIELLDTAGNGAEANRDSYLTIAANIGDLRRRSRFVKDGGPPFGVLAISMGAMIASAWADRHPGEIGAMVLINPSSRSDARFYERLRWRNYRTLLQMTARGGDMVFRERAILRMTAQGVPRLEALAQEFSRMTPTSLTNFARQLVASARYSFPGPPECPALFLASAGDEMVDPVCARRLADRWGAEMEVHPGAGHDLPLMAPEWVVDKVKAFFGG